MRRLSLSAAALAGCIDFGYQAERWVEPDAPLPPDGGSGEAEAESESESESESEAESEGACVEESVLPSDNGPQIHFIVTLQVDAEMLTIASGDVVTWTNNDTVAMPHDVVEGVPNAALEVTSGMIPVGTRWAYRFCDPRTFVWFCGTHPDQMNGYRIVVED